DALPCRLPSETYLRWSRPRRFQPRGGSFCPYLQDKDYKGDRTLPPDLDPGIRRYVEVLQAAGVETFESCEGGKGHAFAEPTIRFHGERAEGFKALSVALQHGLQVSSLRRTWPVRDGEPTGPWWEIVLVPPRS